MARTQRRFQSIQPLGVPSQQIHDLGYYRWITPAEAIAHLGIGSLSALYFLIKEHKLPYGRLGRRYRFRRDHLDQWLLVRGPEAMTSVSRSA